MNTILSITTALIIIALIAISIYLVFITSSLKTELDKTKSNTTSQTDQLSSLKSSFTSMNNQLQRINSVFSSDMKSLNGIETLNMTNGWGLTSSFPSQLQFFGIAPKTNTPKVFGLFKNGAAETPGQMYVGNVGSTPAITEDKTGVCVPGKFC